MLAGSTTPSHVRLAAGRAGIEPHQPICPSPSPPFGLHSRRAGWQVCLQAKTERQRPSVPVCEEILGRIAASWVVRRRAVQPWSGIGTDGALRRYSYTHTTACAVL